MPTPWGGTKLLITDGPGVDFLVQEIPRKRSREFLSSIPKQALEAGASSGSLPRDQPIPMAVHACQQPVLRLSSCNRPHADEIFGANAQPTQENHEMRPCLTVSPRKCGRLLEALNLHHSQTVEAALIGAEAIGRAKPHAEVAVKDQAECFSTVIAPHGFTMRQTSFLALHLSPHFPDTQNQRQSFRQVPQAARPLAPAARRVLRPLSTVSTNGNRSGRLDIKQTSPHYSRRRSPGNQQSLCCSPDGITRCSMLGQRCANGCFQEGT